MKTKKLVCYNCGGHGFITATYENGQTSAICPVCGGIGSHEIQMTNADRINAMTIEEKAEFLLSIAYGRETPWCEQFAEKFCKSCPSTTCTVEGHHHPMDLHECDFTDGKCPHGEDIVWWLQQPCGEEDKHESN